MEENEEQKKVEKKEEEKVEKKEETGKTSEKKVPKTTAEKTAKKETKKEVKTQNSESKKENEKQQDEARFKKAETKKSKVEKKKSHKVLEAIFVIIAIIVAAYCIFAVRNILILNDIVDKAGSYKDIENYSYEHTKTVDGEVKVKTKVVAKDGIIRVDIENLEDSQNNLIVWKDSNTGESIISIPNQKKATVNSIQGIVANLPFEYAEMEPEINGLGLYSLIYSAEYDGKDCYVIHIAPDFIKWVEKDTGLILKEESDPSGVIEITNVQTENIPEIYKPDLTGFEITYGEN